MKKLLSALFLLAVFLILIIYRVSGPKKAEKNSLILTPPVKSTLETQQVSDKQTNTDTKEEIILNIASPLDKSTVDTPTIQVKGQTLPGETVFINEKELQSDSSGNFSTSINLDEGENYVIVVVSDKEGNYAEKDLVVYLETVSQ